MGKNLEKWCTLERAQNNKVYPKGTIYTALSASDGIANQLQEDDYLSDRYAVFIPKTKYINVFYEIFCESFEQFYQKYNQGINFAFNNFKFFDFSEITLSDKELQEMEEALKEIDNLIDNERLLIQQIKGFSKEEKEVVEKWAKILKSGVL